MISHVIEMETKRNSGQEGGKTMPADLLVKITLSLSKPVVEFHQKS